MPLQTGQVVAIKKIQVGEKGEVRLKALASARICRRSAPPPAAAPALALTCSRAKVHLPEPPLLPAQQGVNVTALREVKLLRELRSPYLVRLLDVLPQKRGINLVRPGGAEFGLALGRGAQCLLCGFAA